MSFVMYEDVVLDFTCGCGYLFLSKICCLIIIPEARLVREGTKSFIILNNELSKNLIKRTKSTKL